MKILFIIPPNISYNNFIHPIHDVQIMTKQNGQTYGSVSTDPCLGCLALSSYIKKYCQNIETKLINFNSILYNLKIFNYKDFINFFDDYLKRIYKTYKADIICISSLFITTYQSTINIANICKKYLPSALITLGGGVPSNLYKRLFKECVNIDAICYGEGEIPLADLINNHNFNNCAWITPIKLKNNFIPKFNFVNHLDEIPLYDYGLTNKDDYTNMVLTNSYGATDISLPSIQYAFSRGCIYKCGFCSIRSFHGNKVRRLSLKRILNDLTYFKSIGIKRVIFIDDFVTDNKTILLEILSYFKRLNLYPLFYSGFTVTSLDSEVLCALKDLNIEQLVLPIESGTERILKDIIHKPLNLQIISKVVNECKKLDMYLTGNIMIGLPGETKDEIENSIPFLTNLGLNWWSINAFSPLVGSPLYDLCIQKGYINENTFFDNDLKHTTLTTEHFTQEYIQERKYLLNLELNFINNIDIREGRYKTALLGLLMTIKANPKQAVAHYFISKCYKQLNQLELADKHTEIYKRIIITDNFWSSIFKQYHLE